MHALDLTSVPDLGNYHWPLKVTWESPSGDTTRQGFAGPFFESRTSEQENYFAIRPLGLERHYLDSAVDDHSLSILYPLFSYRNYPGGYQWSVFSLIRSSYISTDTQPREIDGEIYDYYRKSFEIFPFYFDHDSPNPNYDYFGILPFYGEVKNRIFYDRISWVAFPLFSKWEDNDETTYAYLWPFIRYRTGPISSGFSIWPLFGTFQRENDYHYRYALWPLLYYHQDKLHLETPHTSIGILPLYARESRPSYLREDFLWPLFGYTLDYEKEYQELRFLWPIFVQGRGRDRYLNQIAPLYSISHRNGVDSKWFLWPIFNHRSYELNGVDVDKFKILYFLYQNTRQSVANQPEKHLGTKRHLWPLFSYWENQDGEKQFQMFSPLEPLFPNNSEIRKLYSPLFSIVRYQELNPEHKDLELLFSLIQFQRRPNLERLEFGPILGYENGADDFRLELLKGLLGYKKEDGRRILRLFWFDIDLGEIEEHAQVTTNADHE